MTYLSFELSWLIQLPSTSKDTEIFNWWLKKWSLSNPFGVEVRSWRLKLDFEVEFEAGFWPWSLKLRIDITICSSIEVEVVMLHYEVELYVLFLKFWVVEEVSRYNFEVEAYSQRLRFADAVFKWSEIQRTLRVIYTKILLE